MLGLDTLRFQQKQVDEIEAPLQRLKDKVDEAWLDLLAAEKIAADKNKEVLSAQNEFDEVCV